MARFSYRGRDVSGDLVSGTLEGADSGAVADQLLAIGVTPVDIKAARAGSGVASGEWWSRLTAPRVTSLDVMMFSRQMYTLLKAGVPILRALAGLQESTLNRSLAAVIADMRASLDAGRELSTAMRRHPEVFSPFYISVVRIGETSGDLDESFNRLFAYLEFERDMRDRVGAAMRYPLIVLTAITVAIAVVNFAVIPTFARIFAASKVPLPLVTRVLVGTSKFFLAYWPEMLVVIVAIGVGTKLWMATPAGRYAWDKAKLRIPVIGSIVLKATLARFARGMALALRAGVPIVQTLTVVADVVANAYIARRVYGMRDGVERGESIRRTANASGVFTAVVLEMIAVGEETGELDDLLEEVAQMYERDVSYEIKNLSANIEPILTIAMGVLVLILALGVFLPIWDLSSVLMHHTA